jgi:hypothetical protein
MDTNADDPIAALERETLADALRAQRELLELEEYVLRRFMFNQPATVVATFGSGQLQPGEQTFPGDQRDPFNGVVVLNPTPAIVNVGFEAGAGPASPFTVPAFSWVALPVRFVNLSLSVDSATAASAVERRVTALRLRVPPLGAAGGDYGGRLAAANTGLQTGMFTTPIVNSTIVQLGAQTGGLYDVEVVTLQQATADPVMDGMQLVHGAVIVGRLASAPVAVTKRLARVEISPGESLFVSSRVATAVGTVYVASLSAHRIG